MTHDFLVSTRKGASEVFLTPVTQEALAFLWTDVFVGGNSSRQGDSIVFCLRDIEAIVTHFIPPTYSVKWLPPLRKPNHLTSPFINSQESQQPASNQNLHTQDIGSLDSTTSSEEGTEHLSTQQSHSLHQQEQELMSYSRKESHSVQMELQSKETITQQESNTTVTSASTYSFLATSNKRATQKWKTTLRSFQQTGKTLDLKVTPITTEQMVSIPLTLLDSWTQTSNI